MLKMTGVAKYCLGLFIFTLLSNVHCRKAKTSTSLKKKNKLKSRTSRLRTYNYTRDSAPQDYFDEEEDFFPIHTQLERFDEKNDEEVFHEFTRFTNSSNPVDYGDNHPFDIIRRRSLAKTNGRKLSTEENQEFQSFYKRHLSPWSDSSEYKPIRIHLDTNFLILEKENYGTQVHFLETTLLPKVAEIWEKSLRVYPARNNIAITTPSCPISARYQNETGIPNTDLVVFVAANIDSICGTATEPLVAATSCQYDHFDRPTVGRATVCLQDLDITNPYSVHSLFKLLVHGFAHILGFSHKDYHFYYDSKTGQPQTQRPFVKKRITCVDGGEQHRVVPSENTIRSGFTSRGLRYFEVVTPAVKTMARNQFGCQIMEGARLENQPTNNGNCFGSHWEAVSMNSSYFMI